MKSDIEIAEEIEMIEIDKLASKYKINSKYLESYGKYKAKVDLSILDELEEKENGKLILVTSINPTPYGEGKTTEAIGLCDALNKIGYKTCVNLREPSMGPVFGIKGGATGGGYSQIVPMQDINLHFTGDMHAITSANNLLCAIIDNHLYQGNELGFKNICANRCLDVNDRSLRNITINSKYKRDEKFNITVASEIMAILCLAKDFADLKRRISKMIVGFNEDDDAIYVGDLEATDAVSLLLKDAINPNIVQTLEGNLAFVHGGPFANIAHGCSSVISLNMALKLFPYVITEAGFGADLGAEKFFDIVCPSANVKPDLVVLNVTIRSLKHNGGCTKDKLYDDDINFIKKGICNLECHIENLKKFTSNILVLLNYFNTDYEDEIEYVRNFCKELDVPFEVCDTYRNGSIGGENAAYKIVDLLKEESDFQSLYIDDTTIEEKMYVLAKNIYHADKVIYSDTALKKLEKIEKLGLDRLPICVAKTQFSISDDKRLLGYPQDYDFHISDIGINNGAGFIIMYSSDILTMPGLSKESAYLGMHISDDRKISGLF